MGAEPIRLAVIGVGNMGYSHAKDIVALPDAQLVAVCDSNPARAEIVAHEFGVDAYTTHQDLLAHAAMDGVVVATPHYDHVPISIAAMEQGLHVLIEKPIAVLAKNARKLVDAYETARLTHPDLVFAVMFMQRTYGFWRKIKDLIAGGELGQLVRTTWIITDWFRTQAYYDGGGWRATWRGEGGGVLINQFPHNIDLYQWLVGMPQRVTGFTTLGKYHSIEVEDEVTAYFDHDNGMSGHLISTTAESPGTNRLEIVGELGKLVYENGKLTFFRNQKSMLEHIRAASNAYTKVENEELEIPYTHHNQPGHALITENFVDTILGRADLIVPATEGLKSVILSNAIMLSALERRTVELPLDDDAVEAHLLELIRTSRYEKPAVEIPVRPSIPAR